MQASLLTTQSNAFRLPLHAVGWTVAVPEGFAIAPKCWRFFSSGPIHTAYMSGLIRDNGLQSSLNRGTFYGYRNHAGEIEGVALIGHATLMETATSKRSRRLRRQAQQCKSVHMIMCEENRIEKFWSYYAAARPRDASRLPRTAFRTSLAQWKLRNRL